MLNKLKAIIKELFLEVVIFLAGSNDVWLRRRRESKRAW
jgi:hypothetical protein